MLIQRCYRGYSTRKSIEFAKRTYYSTQIQKIIRTFLVKRRIKHLNENATIVQKISRGYITRLHNEDRKKEYIHRIKCIIGMQSLIRGYLDRRRVNKLKRTYNNAVVVIQRAWRTSAKAGDTFITQ